MISNEERQEVMQELRRNVLRGQDVSLSTVATALGIELDAGEAWDEPCEVVWDRMCDLIDRPISENVHDGREFECSECGMTWHLLDRESSCDEWAHVRNPCYCPSCGAEVIK